MTLPIIFWIVSQQVYDLRNSLNSLRAGSKSKPPLTSIQISVLFLSSSQSNCCRDWLAMLFVFHKNEHHKRVAEKILFFSVAHFETKVIGKNIKFKSLFFFLSAFQGKTPVYIAQLCKSGEIFYPGDKLDDWLCDCKPGNYLRHSFKTLLESVLIVAYILLFFPI